MNEGIYAVPGHYVWDNWVVRHGNTLHRYALSAPASFAPEARHDNAVIRHAISSDDGRHWHDLGVALAPQTQARWPNLAVWSGCTVINGESANPFQLFFTGRSRETGSWQQIGLAQSQDGHHFSEPEIVLAPTTHGGYDTTEDDGIIMAWRDPFVFWDESDGQWHMLFAAKTRHSGSLPQACVGHAVAVGKKHPLLSWELLPPLALPRTYSQIEVPQLVRYENKYFLFISTQDHPAEKTNALKNAALRFFWANHWSGPWVGADDPETPVFGHELYAFNFCTDPLAKGKVFAVSFFSEDTSWALCGTPVIAVRWHGNTPVLEITDELKGCLASSSNPHSKS